MPTEIRSVYSVQTKKAGASYQYEPVLTRMKDRTSVDIVNDWIEEERSKLAV